MNESRKLRKPYAVTWFDMRDKSSRSMVFSTAAKRDAYADDLRLRHTIYTDVRTLTLT